MLYICQYCVITVIYVTEGAYAGGRGFPLSQWPFLYCQKMQYTTPCLSDHFEQRPPSPIQLYIFATTTTNEVNFSLPPIKIQRPPLMWLQFLGK